MNLTLRLILPLILVLALTCAMASAAQNPFTGAGGDRNGQETVLKGPAFLSPLLKDIAAYQAQIRSRLTGFAKGIKDQPMSRSFWMFLALSFAYGVVHALGPGHGKAFAVSYFMSRPAGFRAGLALGNLTMAVHVLSATSLVLAGYFLLHGSGAMTAESARGALETASYGLLAGMGLFLAVHTLRAARNSQGNTHSTPENADQGSLALTAVFAGLAPCPGAALVLAYAVSQGIIWTGLAAMLAISLGMGLTTSGFALAAIGARGAMLSALRGQSRLLGAASLALSMLGALGMTALGSLLLLGSI